MLTTPLCGAKKEVEWLYTEIQKKFNIEVLGRLKKHLGIWWDWKKDEHGETYLEGTMPKIMKDIFDKYKETVGKDPKLADMPGFPGTGLNKNEGEIVDQEAYRSLVGKMQYLTTKVAPKLANSVRELSSHLFNPGEEHWKGFGSRSSVVGRVC